MKSDGQLNWDNLTFIRKFYTMFPGAATLPDSSQFCPHEMSRDLNCNLMPRGRQWTNGWMIELLSIEVQAGRGGGGRQRFSSIVYYLSKFHLSSPYPIAQLSARARDNERAHRVGEDKELLNVTSGWLVWLPGQ